MGLFDPQFAQIQAYLDGCTRAGKLRELSPSSQIQWPAGDSLILEEDTAFELGNPGIGSLSFLVWTEEPYAVSGRTLLVGPDIGDLRKKSVPFGQVVMLRGTFDDPYECQLAIEDALYETRLEGFMTRTLPSRQSIWCRVGKTARRDRLSLAHVGAALIGNLERLSFVDATDVLYITAAKAELAELAGIATAVRQVVGALMKLNEELEMDCRSCDFQAVCETVTELRKMRREARKP